MIKNYIIEFMKDNNLEIEEEFAIEGYLGTYMFSKNNVLIYSKSRAYADDTLRDLISGKLIINKLPRQE